MSSNSTLIETLNLLNQKKSIDEISVERKLSINTIKAHIGSLVELKFLHINENINLKGTLKLTYELFKDGLSIVKIALKRDLKEYTIKLHMYDIYILSNKDNKDISLETLKISSEEETLIDLFNELKNEFNEFKNKISTIENKISIIKNKISTIENKISIIENKNLLP